MTAELDLDPIKERLSLIKPDGSTIPVFRGMNIVPGMSPPHPETSPQSTVRSLKADVKDLVAEVERLRQLLEIAKGDE